MKITIKEGKLFIEDVEKETKDLTTDFLERLLEAAVNQDVDFNLEDNTHPLYDFFINLEKDTMPDSDFMKEIKDIEEEIYTKEKKLKEYRSEEEVGKSIDEVDAEEIVNEDEDKDEYIGNEADLPF